MYRWKKNRISWKWLLGKLGVKKYRVASTYAIDWGFGGDMTVETFGYFDENGVLNITDMKVSQPTTQQPKDTE